MTDLEKVQALQEKIKEDKVAVADFIKYGMANKQTFYNLRDDKVNPEKMTVKTAHNLARCYDILFPSVGDSRDYRWGRAIAFLDFISPLTQEERDGVQHKPNRWFLQIHKRRMDLEPKKMIDWQMELASIMDTMSEEDMTDAPLSGMYLLGEGKERYRLTGIQDAQQ